jgi:hypothetical protein
MSNKHCVINYRHWRDGTTQKCPSGTVDLMFGFIISIINSQVSAISNKFLFICFVDCFLYYVILRILKKLKSFGFKKLNCFN